MNDSDISIEEEDDTEVIDSEEDDLNMPSELENEEQDMYSGVESEERVAPSIENEERDASTQSRRVNVGTGVDILYMTFDGKYYTHTARVVNF